MKVLGVYDNGGVTIDRYTVVYDVVDSFTADGKKLYVAVSMSANPFHPQGFGQHGSAMLGRHLGKKITVDALPPDCWKLVRQDLEGGSND
jgi:hypothetical protein